ncbi:MULTISPECIES: zonular occludens toxin domain-containing protein [Amycolatopsis]|uniref:zonular occludens toxin domain-containing protein n=1 Tax=Amycolatopsis TaxID=1813 RepID=UPI000E263EDD|nr:MULTISPECIES: zonular occludens toxin domain-containing protein [Amycolatopsis]
MTTNSGPDGDLARVHYLPAHRGDTAPVEADTEVIEAEIVTDAEYRARQRQLAIERYRGYRNDIVTVGRGTRTMVRWTVQKGRDCADSPIGKFARRHGAYFAKGVEAERQRKKAERGQADARAARARALEQGDLELAARLNEQIQAARHTRVDTLTKWIELHWSVARKAALALVIALGVALVAGVVNGFGHWFGAWNVLDVLHTLGAIITTTGTVVGWSVAHWWAFLLAGLGVWGFRRWKDGRKLGEQMLPEHLRRTGPRTGYVELTESALATALANIGNAKLNAAIKEGWPNRDTDNAWVQFPMVEGKGWSAKIRLPYGVPVAAVNRAKEVMAHNLGCSPQELFIEENADDPTVMDLFRLDPGVLREPVPEYPLVEDGTTDYWTGFPVGINPRGDQVTGVVFERNYVISGIMGSGKTSLVLGLLCGAVLDPLVDIDVFVFAENEDYTQLAPCLNILAKGDTEDNVQACLNHMEALREDLNTRGRLLQKHGITSVADASRDLIAKEPGLRPRIVVIDECQSFFRQDKPEDRRAVVNMMVRFFSAARKYGVTCVFVTPVPSDQSLPRDLVSVTTNRACFAIGDKTRNNVVLGEKAHENGISALGLRPKTKTELNDVGTCVTVGFMDKPGTLRCYNVTPAQQARIVERALELRGGAARQADPTVVGRDWLADLAQVCAGEEKVKLTDAASWMRKLAPDYRPYRKLDGKTLADRLDQLGITVTWPSRQPTVVTQRIHDALAARDAEQQ